MSGGEASAPADATPPDFCARRSFLEVFLLFPRRFPLFALSLFLALLLVPSRSYAWDVQPKGVLYSTDLDGSRVGYVVSAYNQFDAACYAMGKDPNTISTEVKQKLSDSNYGGRFYDYAQSFFTQSGGLENVPTWVPAYVILISELGDLVLSDYQGVWYSTATKSLYDDAMVDFVRVLNGDDLSQPDSSGGTNVSGGFPSSISLNTPVGVFVNSNNWSTNTTPVTGSQTINFSNPSSLGSYLSSIHCSYFYVMNTPVSYRYGGSNKSESPCVYFFASASPVSFSFSNNSGSKPYLKISASSSSTIYVGYDYQVFGFSQLSSNMSGSGTFSGTSFSMSPNGTSYSVYPSRGQGYATCACWNGVSVPDPPAGVWPEPLPTPDPTAPVLPEPVDPTVTPDPVVTDPTVTWPSPTITIDPDPVPGTTPTGLDYTELLTRINDNLISIDSFSRALNSNLNSLRSDLVNEFDGVVQGLRNIYTYLQHMDSVLERHCIHLQNKMEDVSVDIQNKMRELVHWLAEQLDFDSESSGNSDLFGILSTINDKLGGGTYEPNPLKDENAYYDWLDDLWDRFLLGDNWQNSASSMSQSFGQLTSRFPFSVPWDIVALFRLFVHDPVTPVFDLPLYYSSDDSATVRVDLSAWDGVASVVRPLVFVIFALKLALLSRHLLAGFGADKGGL